MGACLSSVEKAGSPLTVVKTSKPSVYERSQNCLLLCLAAIFRHQALCSDLLICPLGSIGGLLMTPSLLVLVQLGAKRRRLCLSPQGQVRGGDLMTGKQESLCLDDGFRYLISQT